MATLPRFSLNEAQQPVETASTDFEVLTYDALSTAGAEGLAVTLTAASSVVLDNQGNRAMLVQLAAGGAKFSVIVDAYSLRSVQLGAGLGFDSLTATDLTQAGRLPTPAGLLVGSVLIPFPGDIAPFVTSGALVVTASDVPLSVQSDYRPRLPRGLTTHLYNASFTLAAAGAVSLGPFNVAGLGELHIDVQALGAGVSVYLQRANALGFNTTITSLAVNGNAQGGLSAGAGYGTLGFGDTVQVLVQNSSATVAANVKLDLFGR